LPSAPDMPLVVTREPDRPQTRRDVLAGGGMTVTAGRIRPDTLFDIKLVALGHNTIRGAAGGSILNAELLASRGLLPSTRSSPSSAVRRSAMRPPSNVPPPSLPSAFHDSRWWWYPR
jgi:hypothetical protein